MPSREKIGPWPNDIKFDIPKAALASTEKLGGRALAKRVGRPLVTDLFRNRTSEAGFYDHVRSLIPQSRCGFHTKGRYSPVVALFFFQHVRFGSETDMRGAKRHVRFAFNSGIN